MDFGRGCALALAFLGMTGPASAQNDSSLVIPVLVYNYAKVSPETLHSAQRQAGRIFRETGVEFEWHECRVTTSEPQKDPYCSHGLRGTDLVLKILPQSRTQAFGVEKDVAGLVPPGEMVSDAFVFYDRLRDIARRESADVAFLLGSIIAHEFGHLLMGSETHSAGGVMRKEWTDRALAGASVQEMEFSPQQSQQIRLGALARNPKAGTDKLARSVGPPQRTVKDLGVGQLVNVRW